MVTLGRSSRLHGAVGEVRELTTRSVRLRTCRVRPKPSHRERQWVQFDGPGHNEASGATVAVDLGAAATVAVDLAAGMTLTFAMAAARPRPHAHPENRPRGWS